MKEKDRYEYYLGTNSIKDNKTNQIQDYVVDLLNQQSMRIKELEEENQQLKQQLHDLPNKIVGDIREVAGDYWEECGNVPDLNTLTMEDFDEILDTILEKFGGEDE